MCIEHTQSTCGNYAKSYLSVKVMEGSVWKVLPPRQTDGEGRGADDQSSPAERMPPGTHSLPLSGSYIT